MNSLSPFYQNQQPTGQAQGIAPTHPSCVGQDFRSRSRTTDRPPTSYHIHQ